MNEPTPRVTVAPAVDGTGSAFAGLVTRLVAFSLDALLINVVAWSVALVVGVALSLFHLPDDLKIVFAAIGAALALAWSIGYFTFFWSTTGQTPGNRVMSIDVRTATGERLHPGRAFLRVLALPLSVIPLGAGLGLILVDRRRRALHDVLVGTEAVYVVRVPRAQAAARPRPVYVPPDAQSASTSPPPSSATRRPKRISAG
jgi:uncharacterized RDD family membrane protein YckC